jgi:uncharacterized repeat protein (TIGR03803 family)
MKHVTRPFIAVYCCAAFAALTACAGSSGANLIVPQKQIRTGKSLESRYKLLYSFHGSPDGSEPGSIRDFAGTLYGTTSSGGSAGYYGTVFEATTSGKERVLYSFKGGSDGAGPSSGLMAFQGLFYGTTYNGGGTSCSSGQGCGTIFAVNSAGKERVVYRFKANKTDGWYPRSSLVALDNLIYGTTASNFGSICYGSGCGTVFGVTSAGKERIVYRFKDGKDGCSPSSLIATNGVLYGITYSGGSNPSGCNGGVGGTVFSLTTSGVKTVLHTFANRPDGSVPNTLIVVDGVLYGTTLYGGNNTCDPSPGGTTCGVVFSVTTSGHEVVLYRFKGGKDGAHPVSLLWLNGRFYGVTQDGGAKHEVGNGTIFSLTKSGSEATLYRFEYKGGSGTLDPRAVTAANDTLYGITGSGGSGSPSACGNYGCGTIYRFLP